MFKGLKDMGGLLKQAGEMKKKMTQVQNELKKMSFTGFGLNKSIEVQVNGEMEILNVKISEEVLKTENKKKIEQAIKEAVNEALSTAKKTAAKELSEITSGLNIPGIN